MREIKFRAWDKQFKEWVDPDIVGRWAIFVLSNENSFTHEMSQFTGLLDRNGKEIYEGDILNCTCYKTPRYVEWLDEGAGFIFRDKNGDDWWSPNCDYVGSRCEVIGNIYENPELLQ